MVFKMVSWECMVRISRYSNTGGRLRRSFPHLFLLMMSELPEMCEATVEVNPTLVDEEKVEVLVDIEDGARPEIRDELIEEIQVGSVQRRPNEGGANSDMMAMFEAMMKEIKAVNNKIETSNSELKKELSNEMKTNQAELENKLESGQARMEVKLANLESKVETSQVQFENLREELKTSQNKLESGQAEINTKLASVQMEVTLVQEKLHKVRDKCDIVQEQLDLAQNNVQRVESNLGELGSRLENVTQELKVVQDQTQTEMNVMKENLVVQIAQAQVMCRNEINQMRGQVEADLREHARVENKETNDQVINEIATDIKTVEAKNQSFKNEIQTQIGDVRSDMKGLENRLIKALETREAETSERIEEIKERLTVQINTENNKVQSPDEVGTLEQRVRDLTLEIRELRDGQTTESRYMPSTIQGAYMPGATQPSALRSSLPDPASVNQSVGVEQLVSLIRLGEHKPSKFRDDGTITPKNFIRNLEEYLTENRVPEANKLKIAERYLENQTLLWFRAFRYLFTTFEEFKNAFLAKYWNGTVQQGLRMQLYSKRYAAQRPTRYADYFVSQLVQYRDLENPPTEEQLCQAIQVQLPADVQRVLIARDVKTAEVMERTLRELDSTTNEGVTRAHSVREPQVNNTNAGRYQERQGERSPCRRERWAEAPRRPEAPWRGKYDPHGYQGRNLRTSTPYRRGGNSGRVAQRREFESRGRQNERNFHEPSRSFRQVMEDKRRDREAYIDDLRKRERSDKWQKAMEETPNPDHGEDGAASLEYERNRDRNRESNGDHSEGPSKETGAYRKKTPNFQ